MNGLQYKVDINPSYEWADEADGLGISHRELEAFALVTEGYSNKEAAEILGIKHQSVKNHMHSLSKKLNVKNNTQAFVVAIHLNLVKVKVKPPKDALNFPVMDYTAEGMIDSMRKVVSGETTFSDWSEKDIRYLKVFMKKHGIDPYEW